jgi:hypothetical protein
MVQQAQRKEPFGRPSIISQHLTDDILAKIAAGQSLNSICKMQGMPHISTVFDWLKRDGDFADKYARARSAQADAKFEAISDVTERVLSGELDPHAGRVAIDAYKWQAGKLRPSVYGEKVEHIVRSGAPETLTDEELARIAASASPALLTLSANPEPDSDTGSVQNNPEKSDT